MPSCRDVARLIASDALNDSGWWRRALVRLHLAFCKHCKRYAGDLRTIGRAGRERWGLGATDLETARRLERAILEEAFGRSDTTRDDPSH